MNSKIIAKKTLLATFVGLFATTGAVQQAYGQDGEAAKAQGRIDEIIVTANKREQSLQNAALSISALSSDTIDKRGLVGMGDYLPTLPGVNMQDRGAGQNNVMIRGVASTPQSEESGVGIYYGETPVTNLTNSTGGGISGSGDLKLVDMERVEVLRGPQGTLYGSGSLSGTVRAIPNSPNLQQIEGKISALYSQTGDQGENNSMIQGMINIPLIEDKLAVRAVAYQFNNSGYIENVAASQPLPNITTRVAQSGVARDRDDIGSDEYTGFRFTVLWQATDQLDITVAHTQQDIEQEGWPEVNLDLSTEKQARLRTGLGGSSDEFLEANIDITNLVANYDLGWATVTSSSSWLDYATASELDISHLAFLSGPHYNSNWRKVESFTEELRLVSQLDGPLQFIGGFYYEDREERGSLSWLWSGDPTLAPAFPRIVSLSSTPQEQKAFFGELSYDLTDQLTAKLGGRHYDYKRERLQNLFASGTHVIQDQFLTKEETGNSYKANLSWSPSDDTLIYGQWSEGFRLGGVQVDVPSCDANNDGILDDVGFRVPEGIDSDTTENFELGLKTSLLDSRVVLNAAIYRINWEGIPVNFALPSCSASVTLNAGKSKSEGVEVEVQTHLAEHLRLDVSASYGEATLTKDAPNIGAKGDNLPASPDFNFSVGLEYGFNLAGYDAFARVDYAYVSEYFFRTTVQPDDRPAGDFGQAHFKAGMTLNNFDIDLFIRNLTNADDLTWVEEVSNRFNNTNRVYRLRPRTVGFNVSYRF